MKDSKKLTGGQLLTVIILYVCVIGLIVLLILNLKKQKEVIQNNVEGNSVINEVEENNNISTIDDIQLQENSTIEESIEQSIDNSTNEEITDNVESNNDSNSNLEDDIFNLMG